jgi:hypothetical protein
MAGKLGVDEPRDVVTTEEAERDVADPSPRPQVAERLDEWFLRLQQFGWTVGRQYQ